MKSKNNEKVMKKIASTVQSMLQILQKYYYWLIYVGLYYMLLISLIFPNQMVFLSEHKHVWIQKGY